MAQAGREKIAICSLEFCDLTTALDIFTSGSCGVVVITCASHAQGPRFDPGQEHILLLSTCLQEKSSPHLLNREIHLLPRGLVVRIRRSHRRGRGSIPRTGTTLFFTFLIHFSLSKIISLIFACICQVLGSIVVSILACHARDRGSIPRRGGIFALKTPENRTNIPFIFVILFLFLFP